MYMRLWDFEQQFVKVVSAYTTPQVGGSFSDCPRPHGGGGGPLRLGRPPPPGPAYSPRPLGGGGPWRFGRQVKELGLGMHVGGVN